MIRVVTHFEDDMVMTFDKRDNRINRYCGPYNVLREHILEVASEDAIFAYAYYNSRGMQKVSKDEW